MELLDKLTFNIKTDDLTVERETNGGGELLDTYCIELNNDHGIFKLPGLTKAEIWEANGETVFELNDTPYINVLVDGDEVGTPVNDLMLEEIHLLKCLLKNFRDIDVVHDTAKEEKLHDRYLGTL